MKREKEDKEYKDKKIKIKKGPNSLSKILFCLI